MKAMSGAQSLRVLALITTLVSLLVSTSGCSVVFDIVDAGIWVAVLFFGGFAVLSAGVLALSARS